MKSLALVLVVLSSTAFAETKLLSSASVVIDLADVCDAKTIANDSWWRYQNSAKSTHCQISLKDLISRLPGKTNTVFGKAGLQVTLTRLTQDSDGSTYFSNYDMNSSYISSVPGKLTNGYQRGGTQQGFTLQNLFLHTDTIRIDFSRDIQNSVDALALISEAQASNVKIRVTYTTGE